MQTHNLKRKVQNKKSVQVGRGSKRGKTSGRGGKGQTARAGHKARPEMRDIIKRLPKLRGYAFNTIQTKPKNVSIAALEIAFNSGDKVTPLKLVEAGVISTYKGRIPAVKILSDGEITKKLTIVDCKISAAAKEKIEKAGGKVL